jgi:hypothetical protein
MYNEKLAAKLKKGINPHTATLEELVKLARAGAFVLYVGADGATLVKQ